MNDGSATGRKMASRNGVLVCGTVRIATADFDTNPSEEVKAEIMDWMCSVLNAAIDQARKDGEA